MRPVLTLLATLWSLTASAAQFVSVDGHEVHYVLVNTLFLAPEVAHRHSITRAKDRAIVNLSVIGPDGRARQAELKGNFRNLIGQINELDFALVKDGEAIYYIAPIKFTDQDVLRFEINVAIADGPSTKLSFQERMWVDSTP